MLLHLQRIERLAQVLHQLGGLDAGAARGIGLAVVVQLGQLSEVIKAGRRRSGLLQENHPDGEVGNHGTAHGRLGSKCG